MPEMCLASLDREPYGDAMTLPPNPPDDDIPPPGSGAPPPPPPGAFPPPGMFVSAGTGGWVPPLIAMLVQGNKSPQVRAHAVAALNFQLLLSIIGVVGWITVCVLIGFIIWPIATLVGVIFGIIAGLRANEGQLYRYPLNISIVK